MPQIVKNPDSSFTRRGLRIQKTLSQSRKGGVFVVRAEGRDLVLKEGRFGTCPDVFGRDSRNRIEHEFAVLKLLEGLDVAPKPVEHFEADGNHYLTMEYLEGPNLALHIEELHRRGAVTSSYVDWLRDEVIRLVQVCHQVGVTLRDIKPDNFIVTPTQLKLVDLEMAFTQDLQDRTRPFFGGTPGYTASVTKSPSRTDPGDDWPSVGRVLFFITTGLNPHISEMANIEPSAHAFGHRFLAHADLLRDMHEAVRLMGSSGAPTDFSDRCNWVETEPMPGETFRVALLEAAHRIKEQERSEFEEELDRMAHPRHFSANFYDGALGLAYALIEDAFVSGDGKGLEGGRRIARHVLDRWAHGNAPVCLYFGTGSLPLILALIGALDSDPASVDKGIHLLRVYASHIQGWDITNGSAGLGLSALRAFEVSGHNGFLTIAQQIWTASMQPQWLTLRRGRSDPSKHVYLGFAHGLAGLAYCAAGMYHYLRDPRARDVVMEVGEWLSDAAVPVGLGYSWDHLAHRETVPWTQWCHGAAGVGLFFLSGWAALKDQQFLNIALGAGRAVVSSTYVPSPFQCHGLAGGGELLWALYRATGSENIQRSLEQTKNHITAILGPRVGAHLEGAGDALSLSYMTGLSGVSSWISRVDRDSTLPAPFQLQWKC